MPRTPSPVIPKPDSAAEATGQFVVVTATSSASPTVLLTPRQLQSGNQFVHIAAATIPGQTAAVTLNIGFGSTGLGFEFDKLIFPLRGFQLVLDWKYLTADIAASPAVVAWASTGSVIVCDVANFSRRP